MAPHCNDTIKPPVTPFKTVREEEIKRINRLQRNSFNSVSIKGKNIRVFQMSKVISIHEYILKPGISERRFEKAILNAKERGLLHLPGLVDYYLVKGIRGFRNGLFAAIWVYESKDAWESLWGQIDKPLRNTDYPQNWKVWENEVLFPFLNQDPDKIKFTSYQELYES